MTQQPEALLPTLEFWPDYGRGPLWAEGQWSDPVALGIPAVLAEDLSAWNAKYEEHALPITGAGDPDFIAEGVQLLAGTRRALAGRYRIVTTEPWWGEPPSE
jgi:hypothetical protein